MAGKTIRYADGTVRTGKYNHYRYERSNSAGHFLWAANELQPAAGQRNKHFYRKAWIMNRVSDLGTLELWSYNTLVMKFDTITRKFSYLDGYAPYGSYRSAYVERRDHETRYNSVTTREHERAFIQHCFTLFEGVRYPTSNAELDSYDSFSSYSQPHYIHVELSADGYAI